MLGASGVAASRLVLRENSGIQGAVRVRIGRTEVLDEELENLHAFDIVTGTSCSRMRRAEYKNHIRIRDIFWDIAPCSPYGS
jgi:hypothetical protein